MDTLLAKNFRLEKDYIFINKITEPVYQPPHTHDFLEIQYVISGAGVHRIGEREFKAGKSDLFFTNYHTPHCFLSESEKNPIVLYNCIFMPEFLEKAEIRYENFTAVANDLLYHMLFPSEISRIPYVHLPDGELIVRNLFETMYREFEQKESGYIDVLFGCLIQLLVSFCRLYQKSSESAGAGHQKRQKEIEDVMSYIEGHYGDELTLNELSKIAFLSPNHLCRVFKDATGITLSEHIQKTRIKEVCRLLRETDQKLSLIAAEVGYRDEGYLRKLFKSEMGKTPTEYRNSFS